MELEPLAEVEGGDAEGRQRGVAEQSIEVIEGAFDGQRMHAAGRESGAPAIVAGGEADVGDRPPLDRERGQAEGVAVGGEGVEEGVGGGVIALAR